MQPEHEDIAAGGTPQGEGAPTESGGGIVLRRLALVLVTAATGLYLLQALGDFLRPFLIAVLLCYAIWPLHARLSRYVRPALSLMIIAVGLVLGSYVIGRMVFVNAAEIWQDMPRYQARAERLVEQAQSHAARLLPALVQTPRSEAVPITLERVGSYLQNLFGIFAGFLAQATIVGLYVVFLLEEASRFPRVIRRAFSPERAARILEVVQSINRAVIDYLSVKVKVNLLVAVPATLLMLGFGVQGAVLWGVVTFFARFIPYLGGIVAYVLPVTVAALQIESPVRTVIFAVALLALHVIVEYVIEPIMTGKAVGLSPLAVLLALAFWELNWGIVGMALAIPLTVILRIALARFPSTRPIARLLSEDD